MLSLTDLPDSTSAMREYVLRLRAWTNHDQDPGELLRRGAVYWYEFHEKRHEKGEVYKTRPVLVMNENPAWCRFMNRALNVLPLSSQEDKFLHKGNSVPVTINGAIKHAVLAQATTINSRRLGSYMGQLDDQQLGDVTQLLRDHILADFGTLQTGYVTPANVFKLAWHDADHRRPFCVLSDHHLTNPYHPVAAMPLIPEHLHENLQPPVAPRPISAARFNEKEAEYMGTLPGEIFERLRFRYARQFGL